MLRSYPEQGPQYAGRAQQPQQRTQLKENIAEAGRPYTRGTLRTEGNECDPAGAKVHARLATLRTKMDQQEYHYPRPDPLNSSNMVNRYLPNTISKLEGRRQSSSNLQRSFSFVNRDAKEKLPAADLPRDQEPRALGATALLNRDELRKNSSFGMLEDECRLKYGNDRSGKGKPYETPGYTRLQNEPLQIRTVSDYRKGVDASTMPQGDELKVKDLCQPADEHRIESIDKINVKIKEILKCLNDTEKGKYAPATAGTEQVQQFRRERLSTTGKPSEFFQQENPFEGISYNRRREQTGRLKTQAEPAYYPKDAQASDALGPMASSAELQSQEASKKGKNRDIDFEIRKIEEKIKRSEEEKQKMNLCFDDRVKCREEGRHESYGKAVIAKNYTRPKEPEAERSSKTAAVVKVQQSSFAPQQPTLTPQQNTSSKNQTVKESQFGVLRSGQKPSLNLNPNAESELIIPKASPLSLKLIPVQCEIEEQPPSNRQCQRFINTLREQVQLDEELRNAKVWLDNTPGLDDKWEQIQSLLRKNRVELPLQHIKSEFQSTLEQHNPFYSAREATGESVATVVEKYLTAREHWQRKVRGCFDGRQLQMLSFTEERLDLQRKGHLTVEDFVRFLNMETGTFYRNRDLVLIFRRLTASDTISYREVMETVARP